MPNYDDDVLDSQDITCQSCGCEYEYAPDEHDSDECPECGHTPNHSASDCNRYSTNVLAAASYDFRKAADEPTKGRLRMGWELECTSRYQSPTLLARDPLNTAFRGVDIPFANMYCITKSDASIRGPNAAEIVSVPLSVPEHARVLFKAFPKGRVGGSSLQCWSNSSCGFHIHVGKGRMVGQDRMSSLTIGKMLLFVNDPFNEGFWDEMCGRSACSYARFKRRTITDYHAYTKGRLHSKRSANGREVMKEDFHKYDALNVSPTNTVEFRLPRPTARIKSLLKNLELYEASLRWADLCSCALPLHYTSFLFWLSEPDNRKTYTYLHDWLARRPSKFGKLYASYL